MFWKYLDDYTYYVLFLTSACMEDKKNIIRKA